VVGVVQAEVALELLGERLQFLGDEGDLAKAGVWHGADTRPAVFYVLTYISEDV
jgi:hypothetical protein